MRRLVVCSLATVALGIAAGLLWERLAEPAAWEVTSQGIILTEVASTGQFSVIVTFVLIGLVGGLLAGLALTWVLRDIGWVLTPVVVLLTLAAAVIAWQVGLAVGPPDPATVTGAQVGDRLPSELEIDAVTPFLVWPITGLLGLMWVMLAVGDRSAADRPVEVAATR